jgi:hypothetical protein
MIRLTPFQIGLAFHAGAQRFTTNGGDRYAAVGASARDRVYRNVNGAAGEIAFAAERNRYWVGNGGAHHDPDIAPNVGIRTRSPSGTGTDLCIRPDDADAVWYVLVIGDLPNYEIVGCIWGADAKRDEWAGWSGDQRVFYVPRSELRPYP